MKSHFHRKRWAPRLALRKTIKGIWKWPIPYIKGVSERIRRILNRKNIRIAFKPLKTLGHVFKKPKDRPTKEQLKGIVYQVSCRTCPFTYVGQGKRSWKSRGAEHKIETNGNIGSAVKHHAETTGHDIYPNYANILETGVKTKNKRLFLESLHSFLDKNSVNERAPFPRVYASLVSFLRSNEQGRLFLHLHSVTC